MLLDLCGYVVLFFGIIVLVWLYANDKINCVDVYVADPAWDLSYINKLYIFVLLLRVVHSPHTDVLLVHVCQFHNLTCILKLVGCTHVRQT